MKPSEILRKAQALVARPGGWRHGNRCIDGEECMWTALRMAGAGGALLERIHWILGEVLNLDECSASDIWRWNDAPERTQAEAVAAFGEAIKLAEARGI